ncbi:MAG: hypothetical protein V3V18_02815 [Methylococcales bacterium]
MSQFNQWIAPSTFRLNKRHHQALSPFPTNPHQIARVEIPKADETF